MTEEAVCVILDKAWENGSRALIYVNDRILFEIHKDTHEWQTYNTLDVLCVHGFNSYQESYIDLSSITQITLLPKVVPL